MSEYLELASMLQRGENYLINHGLPNRHQEDWKYTPLHDFLAQNFTKPTEAEPEDSSVFTSASEAGLSFYIKNGRIQQPTKSTLPEGLQVMSLVEAMQTMPDWFQQAKLFTPRHGLHALNLAALDTTLVFLVAEGCTVPMPVECLYYQDQPNQAVHTHVIVILKPQASMTLVEEFSGKSEKCYLTTRLMSVFLETGSHLSHTLLQKESQAAYHFSDIEVYQQASSRYDNHLMNLGGKWARCDQSLFLQEEKASCLMNGIYAPKHQQYLDSHTSVFHQVSSCESTQTYRGILSGAAQAVFNGRIVVSPHSQKTVATQQNKNLLLSEKAQIYTKPQLEIDANDVKCSHGATVGKLNEEALFYCATRGISKKDAMSFMIDGFSAENIDLFEPSSLRPKLAKILHDHLQDGVL